MAKDSYGVSGNLYRAAIVCSILLLAVRIGGKKRFEKSAAFLKTFVADCMLYAAVMASLMIRSYQHIGDGFISSFIFYTIWAQVCLTWINGICFLLRSRAGKSS